MKYYIEAIKNYATFKGKATREQFWYFTLFNVFFFGLAILMDVLINYTFNLPYIIFPFIIGYSLFIFLPKLSIAVRRLHDVGLSGSYLLVGFIPFFGAIWLIIQFLKPSFNETY